MQLWGDPKVIRYFDSRGQLSKEQVKERLLREVYNQATHGVQYWPLFILDTGDFAGCCGLRPNPGGQDIYETGFHLRPSYWGKGLASEADSAVLHYAFGTLQASAVTAGHNPANTASKGVLLKLGFQHTHDEFYPPTGQIHPLYMLTQEAYRQRSIR